MGIVSRIHLRDFRNLKAVEMNPGPGINVISGANGQGKSSLLEGIYYLAFLRSFRTRRPVEMIRWDAGEFQITATVAPAEPGGHLLEQQTLCAAYSDNRRLSRNGKAVATAVDFINSFLCVALVPEDLGLVKGSPLVRRRYMDMLLCQLSREYLQDLLTYNRALSQRNALLKDFRRYGMNAVRAFDRILADSGARLTTVREKNIAELGNIFGKIYSETTGSADQADLAYVSSIFRRAPADLSLPERTEKIIECLEKEFPRDADRRVTRRGPHRDDLNIQLNGKPLAAYGSEGQCRLGALVLRLAALELLKKQTAEREVVLLIDDVFGELDDRRRQAFFKTVAKADQVMLTCTSIPPELTVADKSFIMDRGILSGG